MQRADPGHPTLALHVLQQRPVEILSLATGHRLDIADHDQQLLRPRDRDVQPLGLLQEADPFRFIAAHQAENHDVGLLTFEGVDRVDRQSGESDHPQLAPQLRDLVLIHGNDGDPQLLEPEALQVAHDAAHRLDLGAVRDAARAAFLLAPADRQPRQVAIERPGQRRPQGSHLR